MIQLTVAQMEQAVKTVINFFAMVYRNNEASCSVASLRNIASPMIVNAKGPKQCSGPDISLRLYNIMRSGGFQSDHRPLQGQPMLTYPQESHNHSRRFYAEYGA